MRIGEKFKRNIIREPAFYKSILTLGIPVALQNMISFAVSLVDTLMLGRADSSGLLLSASSLANQPFFLLSTLCFGLAGGTAGLCTQYYGRGEYSAIRTIFAMTTRIAVYLSLFFSAVVLIFPVGVMSIYSSSAPVIAEGAEYLKIIGWAYVLYGASYTFQCMLRSIAVVNISVITSIASIFINILGNWLLIFGNLGFPALGIRGAAIATLLARAIEFIVLSIYVFTRHDRLSFRPRHLFLRSGVLLRDMLRYGSPVFLNELVWSLASSVQAGILGHIEYSAGDPVAANAICGTVSQLAILGCWGLASGASVMVGSAIGERDYPKAIQRAETLRYLSYALGIVSMAVVFLVREPVLLLYNIEPVTMELTRQMLGVTAVVSFLVCISAVPIVGTLRSAGDTFFCFICETVSLWLFAMPLSFLAANALMLPVPLVMVCMKSDEVIKSIACYIRVKSGKFIKSVTRDKNELTAR